MALKDLIDSHSPQLAFELSITVCLTVLMCVLTVQLVVLKGGGFAEFCDFIINEICPPICQLIKFVIVIFCPSEITSYQLWTALKLL